MTDSEQYPWTRRDDETSQAYDAFREYMHVRSTGQVAERLGKSTAIIERWSARHDWVQRSVAYDRHMETAATDGHAEELSRVRGRHMKLADKLLDHLDRRLDDFIERNEDPTVRWTQAFSAGTKAQESATRMREAGKESGLLETIVAKLEELERGQS